MAAASPILFMYIKYPQIDAGGTVSTQPATATILAVNLKRQEYVITLMSGGPFFIKRGAAASSSNFDFYLSTVGQSVIGNNYKGIITCSPNPTAGQLNVAEGNAFAGGPTLPQ